MEAVTVTDPAVMDMREEITQAVEAYVAEDGEGISVKRMMALATMNSMHQDICILAEELGVSFLVVPFHKDQQADGRLGIGHTGFRHVNRKVTNMQLVMIDFLKWFKQVVHFGLGWYRGHDFITLSSRCVKN